MRAAPALAVGALLGLAAASAGEGNSRPAVSTPSAIASAQAGSPATRVHIGPVAWSRGLAGQIVARFRVTNSGAVPIKDIAVACEFYGHSGTVIDRRALTIYERVEPGETKTTPKIAIGWVSGQSHTGACAVAGYKPA